MLKMNKQRNSNVECGSAKGTPTSSTSSKRNNLSNIIDQGGVRNSSVDQRGARSSNVDQGLLILTKTTNQHN